MLKRLSATQSRLSVWAFNRFYVYNYNHNHIFVKFWMGNGD